ncbi:UNVERIFIED_CONTAM: hypothetical protein FKN15_068003, partial [Acipenser sinensis]
LTLFFFYFQEPAGPPTPKRPRGRPRGSKNKGPRATLKKAEPTGEKRPRGRPRKWVSRNLLSRTLDPGSLLGSCCPAAELIGLLLPNCS